MQLSLFLETLMLLQKRRCIVHCSPAFNALAQLLPAPKEEEEEEDYKSTPPTQ